MTPINYGLCSIELCQCFCTSIHSFVLIIYLTVIQSKSLPFLLYLLVPLSFGMHYRAQSYVCFAMLLLGHY